MGKTYHLNIDTDKECLKCHEKGATPSGFCVDCISTIFKDKTIGFVTIQQMKAEACHKIDEYAKEIDEAYVKADGEATVKVTLALSGTKMAGQVELKTTIRFVKDLINDSSKTLIHESQLGLPGIE